jgi:hypothetical protein
MGGLRIVDRGNPVPRTDGPAPVGGSQNTPSRLAPSLPTVVLPGMTATGTAQAHRKWQRVFGEPGPLQFRDFAPAAGGLHT